MKVYYEALDGTIFHNEYDCEEYERNLAMRDFREKIKGSKCWDSLRRPIEVDKITLNNVDTIDYFFVSNIEALKAMEEMLHEVGICTPLEDGCEATAGHFFYDNGWQCCEEQIEYYQNIIEKLEGKEI